MNSLLNSLHHETLDCICIWMTCCIDMSDTFRFTLISVKNFKFKENIYWPIFQASFGMCVCVSKYFGHEWKMQTKKNPIEMQIATEQSHGEMHWVETYIAFNGISISFWRSIKKRIRELTDFIWFCRKDIS